MKSTSFLVVTVSIATVKFNSKQTSSIGIIAKDLLVYLQKHGKETYNLNEFLSKPFCRIENCGDSAARHESSCSSVVYRVSEQELGRSIVSLILTWSS